MPTPLRAVLKTVAQRLAGIRPGALRALLISLGVGLAAAVATYKLLRSGD